MSQTQSLVPWWGPCPMTLFRWPEVDHRLPSQEICFPSRLSICLCINCGSCDMVAAYLGASSSARIGGSRPPCVYSPPLRSHPTCSPGCGLPTAIGVSLILPHVTCSLPPSAGRLCCSKNTPIPSMPQRPPPPHPPCHPTQDGRRPEGAQCTLYLLGPGPFE